MATKNQSPSYNEERERARRWLTGKDPNAKVARDKLREVVPDGVASRVLDDDEWVDWDTLVKEHRHDAVIAANNQEAREAFNLARQSTTAMTPPLGRNRFRHVASIPQWYHWRRMAETGDPKYWDDPVNRYRELLKHPEWSRVPMDYVRGMLEAHLPKGQR